MLIFALFANSARGEFGEGRHVHHMFNARLLKKDEKQMSVVGNFRYGASENFELGTQAVAFLGKFPNLALKHRMFSGERFETAYSMHLAYVEVEEDTTRDGLPATTTYRGPLLFHGVSNTYSIAQNHYLSLGLNDLYHRGVNDEEEVRTVHVLTPSAAWDFYLEPKWALTGIVVYPLLVFVDLKSDRVDESGRLDLLSGIPTSLSPTLFFCSLTRSWDTVNFEFGAFYVPLFKTGLPYLNLYWRFM